MFSFFKKQKADIHSIQIPGFGWAVAKNNSSIIQWINPERTIAVSVNFFDLPPDIPTILDIDKLRTFYRQSVSSVDGGLIEIDILRIKNISAVKAIFKIPQTSSGITYIASLTIPFENCSYVIKVQCAEIGIAGLRDSVIANKLLADGELKIGDNGYENWFSDPYDETHKSKTLMNKSEQSIYDKDFPDHPLTHARRIIEKIRSEIIFGSEIEKLNTFKK